MRTCRSMIAAIVAFAALIGAARAADFHVTTAQELQSALTVAAANGVADTIYLAAGYYVGNFNYNGTESFSLTVQAEDGVSRNDITIDPNGTGRGLTISSSGAANITITGITFLRNCGVASNAVLRTANVADVLVQNCRFLNLPSIASYGTGIEVLSARDVSIRSCIVRGPDNNRGRGILVSGATRNVSVVENIITQNSISTDGGIVYVSGGSTISFTGNTISSNSAGVYISANNSTVLFAGNTISGNSGDVSVSGAVGIGFTGNTISGNSGAGVSLQAVSSWVEFTGNTISGNGRDGVDIWNNWVVIFKGNTISSNSGYGLSLGYVPTGVFIGNTISGNGGGGNGGGVRADASVVDQSLLFSNNVVSANQAPQGGGICSHRNTVLLANTFIQNRATSGSGGGVYLDSKTNLVANNVFAANAQTGSGQGGGLCVTSISLLDMVNNTLTANSAADGGGVAFLLNGVTETLHVYNNVFWNNVGAGSGGDVYLTGTGARTEFVNNNASAIAGTWGVSVGNIDVAPSFADAANNDYHLTTNSPCVNAGTNNAPQLPATDADGDPRIAGGRVDMGAYEFSNTDRHPADTNGNWVIEAAEFDAYSDAWRNGRTWGATSNAIPATYVTRAGYLKANGGAYRNDGAARPLRWKIGP